MEVLFGRLATVLQNDPATFPPDLRAGSTRLSGPLIFTGARRVCVVNFVVGVVNFVGEQDSWDEALFGRLATVLQNDPATFSLRHIGTVVSAYAANPAVCTSWD